jgi:hypothetical protein
MRKPSGSSLIATPVLKTSRGPRATLGSCLLVTLVGLSFGCLGDPSEVGFGPEEDTGGLEDTNLPDVSGPSNNIPGEEPSNNVEEPLNNVEEPSNNGEEPSNHTDEPVHDEENRACGMICGAGQYCNTASGDRGGVCECIPGFVSIDASTCVPAGYGNGADGNGSVEGSRVLDLSTGSAAGRQGADAPWFAAAQLGHRSIGTGGYPQGLAPGDEVLVINLQARRDGVDLSRVGRFRLARVSGVNNLGIEVYARSIDSSLREIGLPADYVIAVVRVPNYGSLTLGQGTTLTARGFDGSTGGVLAIRVADQLWVEGGAVIDMAGRGYRGGQGISNNELRYGQAGESRTGQGSFGQMGGNDGGGGGKYCGAGGGFRMVGQGCRFYADLAGAGDANYQNVSNGGGTYGGTLALLMGSGGGSPQYTADSSLVSGGFQCPGNGGSGGGVVMIGASLATIDGTINAQGVSSNALCMSSQGTAAGGAGAGGTILFGAGQLKASVPMGSVLGGPSVKLQTAPGANSQEAGFLDFHGAGGQGMAVVQAQTLEAAGHPTALIEPTNVFDQLSE